jgi:putative endopeptidase
VKPGDDFFAYANGTWLKTTEIPPDKSGYGAGAIVFDRTHERITRSSRRRPRAPAPAGSDARKIGDYYASYLDLAGIEAKGLGPLQPTLERDRGHRDRRRLARYVGGTLRARRGRAQQHELLHRQPVRRLGRRRPRPADALRRRS